MIISKIKSIEHEEVIYYIGLVLQVIIVDAQSVSGSLVDEKRKILSVFANVVLLSSKRFTFLCKVQLAMNKEFSA